MAGAEEVSGDGPGPGVPAAVCWAQALSRNKVTAAAAVHKPRSLVIGGQTYPGPHRFLPLSGKRFGLRTQ
ncbi:hypothetical protein Aau02nite_33810 [Amorphoplanes auranticolor]|uniref:Uncharacterized protein n=1 Tax=Actinoplanes auranticolor TaxID=47988 RepID=A0A919SAU8_9ACTN|nr:hypothetical protein Aau02nite_33810 [Actinoplanes auranticolor]